MPSLIDLFSSEIEAEFHQHLLEKGNLNKPKRHTEWTEHSPWVSQGYLARVSEFTCTGCSTRHQSLLGIFHLEIRGTDRRETALSLRNFQMNGSPPVQITLLPPQAICAACL